MPKINLEKAINLDEVLKFATEKHKEQKRDDGEPYIVHPIRVAKIVDEYKAKFSQNREVLIASALLHDTLEDTYTSYRELQEKFGKEVASIVEELTTAPCVPKMIGKGLYLAEKMQMMTNYALIIKFADRYDNLCDLNNSSASKREKTINDTIFIIDYLQKHRNLTDAQEEIQNLIKQKINELTGKEIYNFSPKKEIQNSNVK